MSNTKETQKGVTSPLPVMSPIQPDAIDADKVPIKRQKIQEEDF